MKKVIFAIYIIICCIMIGTTSNAKYTFTTILDVADINIKINLPKIEILQFEGGHIKYNYNINCLDAVQMRIGVSGKDIEDVQKDKIQVLLDGKPTETMKLTVKKEQTINGVTKYFIRIVGFYGEGKLSVVFTEGTVTDINGMKSKEVRYDSNVVVDGSVPEFVMTQTRLDDGSVEVKVEASEPLRPIEGWKSDETGKVWTKIYTKTTTEREGFQDYAGNTKMLDIIVKI